MQLPSSISLGTHQAAPSTGVYIGLGSNLAHGDLSPHAILDRALERLATGGDEIIARSCYWISDAWPTETGAPKFINAVCRIHPSDNDPASLLIRLHEIEAEFGRLRDQKNRWSPRSLDLDLLDYNGLISENYSFLTLPHPRIAERDFVLRPLLQIAPSWAHPVTGETGSLLLAKTLELGNTNNCHLFVK